MLDRLGLLARALIVGEAGHVLRLRGIKSSPWLVWLIHFQATRVVNWRLASCGLVALPAHEAPYIDALA